MVLVLGLAASTSFAVHDEGVFELDGDPVAGSQLNDNSDPTDAHDWDQIFADFQANNHDPATNTSGSEAFTFVQDIVGAGDDILFGGATKDINDLDVWETKQTATTSVQDKDDIANAFAAQYLVDRSGDTEAPGCGSLPENDPDSEFCVLLYFGADRFANSGDTTMGFWFFHNEVTEVAGGFDGVHQARDESTGQAGDILVVADFLTGGKAPTVQVFEWVTSGGSHSTHLDLVGGSEDPAACTGGPPPKANATPVPPVGANDDLCATTNQKLFSPVPWDYTPKANTGAVAQQYPISGFMEGGINMTALGFGNECFASFLAETRASHSVTSTLSDFALGGFGECETDVTTTPSKPMSPPLSSPALFDTNDNDIPDIQIGTGDLGVDVVDRADVTVSGVAQWSGTLDFFICGPLDNVTDPDVVCDTGGVPSGEDIAVDQNNPSAVSAVANLTSIGYYCWRGEFTPSEDSAESGVEGDTDASTGECFEVLPVTPALSTQAIQPPLSAPVSGPVPFGEPLYDKASLGGTADEPGNNGGFGGTYLSINATNGEPADGTITFTLLGPDDCLTEASSADVNEDNPQTVDVSGDGDYFSAGFTPDLPGDYHWVAEYSGSTSKNTTGTDHNTDCSDSNEDVTVEQLQPTMSTAQTFIPNDAATITVEAGAGDLDGTVTFTLFVDDDTCSGTGIDFGTFDVFAADTGTDPLVATAYTTNTTFEISVDADLYWLVTFESDTGSHLGITGTCGNENSSITIDNGVIEPSTP